MNNFAIDPANDPADKPRDLHQTYAEHNDEKNKHVIPWFIHGIYTARAS